MIEKVIDFIVEYTHPEAIILFGSRARGDYREDSDYDLLIVKNKIESRKTLMHGLLSEMSKRRLSIPVDILAVEKEKFIQHKNTIGLVYKEIHQEGKIVYGSL